MQRSFIQWPKVKNGPLPSFTSQTELTPSPVSYIPKQSSTIHPHGPLIWWEFHNTHANLQLSLSPMGSPHHPSLNPMPIQLSPPHDHPLPLDHLNQLMSCLSIKTTNNEEVTYVRIPIHPRTLVAWNQMTKTPILPLWLDSSTHRRHRRNGASRTHPLRLDSSISAKLSVDPCVKKKNHYFINPLVTSTFLSDERVL